MRTWQPIFSGDQNTAMQRVVFQIAAALREQRSVVRQDRSLGSGDAGTALLFAYLRKAGCSAPGGTGDLVQAGLQTGLAAFPSLYHGVAGVLWTAAHTGDRQGPGPAAAEIAALARSIAQGGWSGHYDLMSGLLGLGVFALERPDDPSCRELATAIVGWFDAAAERRPEGLAWRTPTEFVRPETGSETCHPVYNLGLAHGVAGIIAFLARACSADVARDRASSLLVGAVAWLLGQECECSDGLRYRYFAGAGPDAGRPGLAWCYGVLGIAAAVHLAGRCLGERRWQATALEYALDAARRPIDLRGMEPGLCHGAAGVGHVFNRLYQASCDLHLRAAAQSWFEAVLCLRRSGEGVAGFSSGGSADPSFLTGAAGIGLALLAAVTPIAPEWDAALLLSGISGTARSSTPEARASAPRELGSYRPADFFVLRTPLLPYDRLARLSEVLAAPASDEDGLQAAVHHDRTLTVLALQDALGAPEVREAIWLAAPALYARLVHWQPGGVRPEDRRFERALVRYVTRMSSRPTPFGLLAGCSVGRIAARTDLVLGASTGYRKQTCLAIDLLQRVGWSLARDTPLAGRLRYRPNPTLCRGGKTATFAAPRGPGADDGHDLMLVEITAALDRLLATAHAGGSFADLTTALRAVGLDGAAADALVQQAIDARVVLADIEPFVTGPDGLEALQQDLQRAGVEGELAALLACIAAERERLDRAPFGVDPSVYEPLMRAVRRLPVEPAVNPLHTVLVKSSPDATLGADVITSLAEGVQALQQIQFEGSGDPLLEFRTAFERRYGTGPVRLTDLFPAQSNVPPLLEGLRFPVARDSKPWTRRDAYLLRKLEAAWASRSGSLRLEETELEELCAGKLAPLPQSFAVIATVLGPSIAPDGPTGLRTLLHAVSGPGGASILGRFCHADPELRDAVRSLLAQEEALAPTALFAEIVFMPPGRAGNVVCRPVLREYEIVVSGRAGTDREHQIPLTDLVVSVDGDRVHLWSISLAREIIPRLTAAYMASDDDPLLYRFLGQLQAQGSTDGLVWDWGPFERCERLPRVVIGRTILSRARWTVRAPELGTVAADSDAGVYRAIQAWRRARGVPRHVALVHGDVEMLVDLCHIAGIRSLLDAVHNTVSAVLVEAIDGPLGCSVSGPEGQYTHQAVVPFIARRPDLAARPLAMPDLVPEAVRNLVPGSDWLSAAIFMNVIQVDDLIEEVVAPFADRLRRAGQIDRWFFVRYGEPDWHLRVRLHGTPEALPGIVAELRSVLSRFFANGHVYRVVFDTYQREIERYGGRIGIELAERIFHADSEATARLLTLVKKAGGEEFRWRVALLGSDALLADLCVSLSTRLEIVEELLRGFGLELGRDAQLARGIGETYRATHRELEMMFMGEREHPDPDVSAARRILGRRSERIRLIAAALRRERENGCIDRPLGELAVSYVHMFANRILREAHRRQEMVLYDFLARLYRSQLARGRGGGVAQFVAT